MKYTRTKISEIVICEPQMISDERGHFMETFRQDLLEKFIGYEVNFCQDNESKSSFGVLRGLHYQTSPYAQTKLVRVIKGSVLDVIVDVRKGSPTFGEYISIELNEINKRQVFIPKGFAHGYVVLSDEAIFSYKVDNYYSPTHDSGIAYNDAKLNIDWRLSIDQLKLSEKDKNLPSFDKVSHFNFKES